MTGKRSAGLSAICALAVTLAIPTAAAAAPTPPTGDTLVVETSAGALTTGELFSLEVCALASGSAGTTCETGTIDTNAAGALAFSSTDPGATLPGAISLSNGIYSGNASLVTIGAQTITVTDSDPGHADDLGSASFVLTVAPVSLPVSAGGNTTFTVSFHGLAAALGSVAVLTAGAANLDFADAGGGTCDALGTPSTCTVKVSFTPTRPGLRKGAVELYDSGNQLVATVYLAGIGQQPLASFSGQTATTVASGLSQPSGIAVDGAGNVFFTDRAAGKLYELAGGAGTPAELAAGSFTTPMGVAVDGVGNLWVADAGANSGAGEVFELPLGHYAASAVAMIAGASGSVNLGFLPEQVYADGAGNVFIAGTTGTIGYVGEIPSSGGVGAALDFFGSGGYPSPAALIGDAAGNLYLSDPSSNVVIRLSPAARRSVVLNDATSTGNSCGGCILGSPDGLALDAAGNLYISSTAGDLFVLPAGSPSLAQIATGGATGAPLALDANGNLWLADWASGAVSEFGFGSLPASFADFGDVLVNAPVSAAANTVTNAGNLGLNFTAYATLPPAGLTVDAADTCHAAASSEIAAGASCAMAIDFTATALGPVGGGFNFQTGNAAAGTTPVAYSATINATGAGTLAFVQQPVTNLASGVAVAVQDYNQDTISSATGTVALSLQAISGSGTLSGGGAQALAGGVASFSGLNVSAPGSYTLTALPTIAGVTNAPVSNSFAVTTSNAATHFAVTAATAVLAGAALTVAITAENASNDTVTSYAGAVTLSSSDGQASLGSVSLTSGVGMATVVLGTAGSQTVTATDAANDITGTSGSILVEANQFAFPAEPVGTASPRQTVTFAFGGTVTLAAANAVNVWTHGAPGGDFAATGDGTCGNGFQGSSCTVTLTFTPSMPGGRPGAVVVYDSAGTAYTTFLSGIGEGPLAAYPAVQTVAAGYSLSGTAVQPGALATDGAHLFFISVDSSNYARLCALPIPGFAAATPVCTGDSNSPQVASGARMSVALDGAGNVYTVDGAASVATVYRFSNAAGILSQAADYGTATFSSFATGLDENLPGGATAILAVDSGGNVFVTDRLDGSDHRIDEFSPAGVMIHAIDTSTSMPGGLVVDAAGDLIFEEYTGPSASFIQAAAGTLDTSTILTLATGFSSLFDGIDAAGNLYVASPADGRIFEYFNTAGTLEAGATLTPNFEDPDDQWGGFTIDAAGNLYLGDSALGSIAQFSVQTAPSLSFPGDQEQGTAGAAAPTTTITNLGNESLSFIPGSLSASSEDSADFAIDGPCTSGTVSVSSSCTLAVEFTPGASGARSATVTPQYQTTDTNPYSATQAGAAITLAGTGALPGHLVFTANVAASYPAETSFGVVVSIEDAAGNVVQGDNSAVQLTLNQNGNPGALAGTASATAVNGVATFSGLSVDRVGNGYTLSTADSDGSFGALTGAASNGFSITVGPAAQLAFTTQPSNALVGGSVGSVVVAIEDAAGDLETTDTSGITLSLNPGGNAGALSGTATVSAAGGIATFAGLSVTASGSGYSLIAADQTDNLSGFAGGSFDVHPRAVAFGAVAVGASSGAATITLDFGGSVTLAASGAVSVLTQGNPDGDFTNAGGGSCGDGNSLPSCTVKVNFTPTRPGLRPGAVVVYDSAGRAYTVYLSAVGSGGEAAYPAVGGSAGYSGSGRVPQGVATDGVNLYFVDSATGSAELCGIPVASYSTATPVCTSSGHSPAAYGDATSVALDGAGNVYILGGADGGTSIQEFANTGGKLSALDSSYFSSLTSTAFASIRESTGAGAGQPELGLLATDGAGNLFAYEAGLTAGQLDEFAPSGVETAGVVTQSAVTAINPSYILSGGLATDAGGNLYFSVYDQSTGQYQVYQAAAGTFALSSYVPESAGLGAINALDAAGDLYSVAASNAPGTAGTLSVYAPGSATPSATHTLTGGSISALALDASGDLFASDPSAENLDGLIVSAANFAFGALGDGASSTQTLSLTNIGNYALPFGLYTISDPTDYAVAGADTCQSATWPAGQSCTLAIRFTPTAGAHPATVTPAFASAEPTLDAIQLTGTGIDATKLVAVSTNGTAGATGSAAVSGTYTLVIAAEDSSNTPAAGIPVTLTPGTGSDGGTATCLVCSGTTGPDGQFTATLTANTIAKGNSFTAVGSSAGLANATFTLTNLPGTAAQLVFTAEPALAQTAGAGIPVTLTEEDADGNPELSDDVTTVTLTIDAAHNPGSAGLHGTAGGTLQAGAIALSPNIETAGNGYELAANGGSLPAATSSPINVAAALTASVNVSGGDQSATVGEAFASPLEVTALDAYNNPVAGVSVTFSGPGSGAGAGFSNGGSATTASDGTAAVTATANHVSGAYSVHAVVGGITSPVFALTNLAGAAAALTLQPNPALSGNAVAAGSSFMVAIAAFDEYNNPATSWTCDATLTSTDPGATLGSLGSCSAGNAIATVSLVEAGIQTVGVRENGATNTPYSLSVTPATATVGSSSSQTVTLTRSLTAPLAVSVTTQGASGRDFTDAGIGTCASATGVVATCTVNLNFNPTAPGLREGAVTVTDAAGGSETVYLSGIGQGPLLAFAGAAPTTSALFGADSVAAGGAGTFYALANGHVYQGSAGGSISAIAAFPGDQLTGIAVDGAGNLYLTDSTEKKLYLLPRADPGAPMDITPGGSVLSDPRAVYVDGGGDIFIADDTATSGRIFELPSGTVAAGATAAVVADSSTLDSFGIAVNAPNSLAEDAAGNLYFSDVLADEVFRLAAGTWSGGPATTAADVADASNGLGEVYGVAVAPNGDVLISDDRNQVTTQPGIFTVAGGSYTHLAALPELLSSVSLPIQISLDADGDLFVADEEVGVVELNRRDVPPQSLAYTAGGAPAASTISFSNIGNAAAINLAAVLDADATAAGFTIAPAALNGCGSSLVVSAACADTLGFSNNSAASPQIGVLTVTSDAGDSPQAGAVTATITAGPASALGFTSQPAGAAVTHSLGTVAVAVEDQYGNPLGSAAPATQVSLGILDNPGSGTLSGVATATTVNGVATFSGLSINAIGAGYSLQATSIPTYTAAASSAFNIVTGPPAAIAASAGAAQSAVVGAAFADALQATITDISGDPVSGATVTFTLTPAADGAGAGLSGASAVTDGSGHASVTATANRIAGSYLVSASVGGVSASASYALTNTPGAATQMAIRNLGALYVAGAPIAFTIALEDANGNVETSDYGSAVTIALSGSGATLQGATTETVAAGVASFSVAVDAAGSGYTLSSTSGALSEGPSSPMAIAAGSASRLLVAAPASATASVQTVVAITAQDSFGNTAIAYTGTVRLGSSDGAAMLAPNQRLSAGTGNFAVTFNTAGSQTLTATDTVNAAITGTSGTVTVAPVPSTNLNAGTAGLTFAGQPVTTASPAQSVVITNSGGIAASIGSIAISGPNAADFNQTNGCGLSLAAGAACTIGVVYTPAATGPSTATLAVTSSAKNSPTTVSLSGTGIAAGVSLTPTALDFGTEMLDTTGGPLPVTITNIGDSVLTISNASVSGEFTLSAPGCASVQPAATCTLEVGFAPTAAGAATGMLTLTDNAGTGTQTLALSGTGIAPDAVVSTLLVSFGSQTDNTSSDGQTVTLTNSGTAPLSVGSVTVSPSAFTQTNSCSTVAAGGHCNINIVFTPTGDGPASGVLAIADSAADSPQTVSLSGSGVTGLMLAPSTIGFGSYLLDSTSPQQTVNLTNTGSGALTLAPPQVSGDFAVTANLCTAALAPAASCQILLVYTPSALGPGSGALTLSDTGGLVTATAMLNGRGVAAGIQADPAVIAFGSAPVDVASASQTITIVNNGSGTLTIEDMSTLGDFTVAGSTCLSDTGGSRTLAANANCIVSLTMTATSVGSRTGTLQIFNSANGELDVALNGVGQGAGVTVAPAQLSFGSQPIPGGQVTLAGQPQTVTVTNTGNSMLAIGSIAVQGGFAQANTCGTSLAAGASCTVSVSFQPTALGQWTGTLTLTDNSTASPQQVVTLTGIGSPNGLVMSPAALNFGGLAVGQTGPPATATLTNNTGQTISPLAITASGEFAETDNCGTALVNGATCTISATVTPLLSGAITGSILVSGALSGAGTSPGQSRRRASVPDAAGDPGTLAGIALQSGGNPPGLSLSASTLAFASTAVATSSAAQTVTVSNTSSSSTLTGLSIGSTPDFPEASTCAAILAAGATCTVTVTFTPQADGYRTGQLTVAAAGGLSATAALGGTATQGALAATPADLSFPGSNGNETLANTGTAAVMLQSFTMTNPDFALSSSTCGTLPAPLEAGATCTLSIVFTPSSNSGESGMLTVASNASNGAVSVALNGSGSTAGVAISPSSLTYAVTAVGSSSAAQTVQLNNTGSAAITIGSIAASGDFSDSSTCLGTLGAGRSCTVSVIFQPTAAGGRVGTLTIVDSAATQTVALAGTASDFSMALPGSPSVSVNAGASATSTVNFASLAGDSQTLALSCGIVTPNAGNTVSCSFNPATVTIGGAGASSMLTIVAQSRSAAAALPQTPAAPLMGALAALVASLAWMLLADAETRRRWKLALVTGTMALASACAQSAPSAQTAPPATNSAGTYQATLTAVSSSGEVHTASITILVN